MDQRHKDLSIVEYSCNIHFKQ